MLPNIVSTGFTLACRYLTYQACSGYFYQHAPM